MEPRQEQYTNVEQIKTACWKLIETLPPNQECEVLSSLFDLYFQRSTILRYVRNFIQFSVNGMNHLKQCNCSNYYLLSKSLDNLTPDGSDSLLPAKKMPMGLIKMDVAQLSVLHPDVAQLGAEKSREIAQHSCSLVNYYRACM